MAMGKRPRAEQMAALQRLQPKRVGLGDLNWGFESFFSQFSKSIYACFSEIASLIFFDYVYFSLFHKFVAHFRKEFLPLYV